MKLPVISSSVNYTVARYADEALALKEVTQGLLPAACVSETYDTDTVVFDTMGSRDLRNLRQTSRECQQNVDRYIRQEIAGGRFQFATPLAAQVVGMPINALPPGGFFDSWQMGLIRRA